MSDGATRVAVVGDAGAAVGDAGAGAAELGRPRDVAGLAVTLGVTALTATGVALAAAGPIELWALGQGVLALAFFQWLVVLHEAGHATLFRSRRANRLVGHLASLPAVIPFEPWRRVHARHHRWTGWQDVDPTTQALAPRTRGRLTLLATDLFWWTFVPIFTLVYRVENYLNPRRLARLFPGRARPLVLNLLALLLAWAAVAALVGPARLLWLVGTGRLLALVLEESVLLSQHTHVPQRVAAGVPEELVRPIPAALQPVYTRSILFPRWVARFVLLGFGEHEKHHAHPHVPGYDLWRVPGTTPNGIAGWRYLWRARTLPGEVFLFKNRDETGVAV